MDRGEGDVVPGDLVPGEERHLLAFRPGLEARARQAGAVDHLHLADARDRVDAQQQFDLYGRARFFPGLARRTLFRGLVVFHVARGQGPVARARLDRPAAEQQLLPAGHDGADHDLRVLVGDEAARVADQPLPVVALGDAALEALGLVAAFSVAHGDPASRSYFSAGLIMRPRSLPAKMCRWKWGTSWCASRPVLARTR